MVSASARRMDAATVLAVGAYFAAIRKKIKTSLSQSKDAKSAKTIQGIIDFLAVSAGISSTGELAGSRALQAFSFLPWTFLGAKFMRPQSLKEGIIACGSSFVWSAWHVFVLKLLSGGRARKTAGAWAPFLTLLFALARPKRAIPSFVETAIVRTFWDPPLMIMVFIHNMFGSRFLHDGKGNFASEIDDEIVMSSMPLTADVDEMVALNVKSVINMQGEWGGPSTAYAQNGIKQLRLPTLDTNEPSYKDLVTGIKFIRKRMKEAPGSKVLIHCKGGRGRASAMTAAYLLSKGFNPKRVDDSASSASGRSFSQRTTAAGASARVPEQVANVLDFMHSKRPVVETSVAGHEGVLQVYRRYCGGSA